MRCFVSEEGFFRILCEISAEIDPTAFKIAVESTVVLVVTELPAVDPTK